MDRKLQIILFSFLYVLGCGLLAFLGLKYGIIANINQSQQFNITCKNMFFEWQETYNSIEDFKKSDYICGIQNKEKFIYNAITLNVNGEQRNATISINSS